MKRAKWYAAILVATATAAAPQFSSAQPVHRHGANAWQLADGDTLILRRGAASLISGNPAQLADGVAVSLLIAQRELVTERHQLPAVRDNAGLSLLPAIACAISLFSHRLTLGLAFEQRDRLDIAYPPPSQPASEDAARYVGTNLALDDKRLTLGASFGLWNRLRFGAALQLSLLQFQQQRTLWLGEEVDPVEDSRFDSNARLDVGGWSLIVRLGLSARLTRWLDLALTIDTPFGSELSGELALDTPAQPPSGASKLSGNSGSAQLSWVVPLQAVVALSAQLHTHWKIALGGHYRHGQQRLVARSDANYQLTTSTGEQRTIPIAELPLALSARNSFGASVALTWHRSIVSLTGGYGFSSGTMDLEEPSTLAVDIEHHRLGGAIEVELGRLQLGFAFSQTIAKDVAVAGDKTTLVNPITPQRASVLGWGIYRAAATRAALQANLSW